MDCLSCVGCGHFDQIQHPPLALIDAAVAAAALKALRELGLVVVEAMGAEEALGGAVGSSVVLWGSSASARDQARNQRNTCWSCC